MTKLERIDGFTDAVLAACEVRDARQERGQVAAERGYHSPLATSVAQAGLDYVLDHSADSSGVPAPLSAGTAALVRNLADGMKAGDWDGYAARQMLDRVHKRLIDLTLAPGCDDARWRALKDARGIVVRAIMGMCR